MFKHVVNGCQLKDSVYFIFYVVILMISRITIPALQMVLDGELYSEYTVSVLMILGSTYKCVIVSS